MPIQIYSSLLFLYNDAGIKYRPLYKEFPMQINNKACPRDNAPPAVARFAIYRYNNALCHWKKT